MPGSHWMIALSPENFEATRKNGFTVQGVKNRHRKKAERMAPEIGSCSTSTRSRCSRQRRRSRQDISRINRRSGRAPNVARINSRGGSASSLIVCSSP